MAKLEGNLTKKQRIAIAKDVIALCRSGQRKFKVDTNQYLLPQNEVKERELLEDGTGQLTPKRLPACQICARGAMFVTSIDRYDRCSLEDIRKSYNLYGLADVVVERSEADWGVRQACLIEAAFEKSPNMWGDRFGLKGYDKLDEYIDSLPRSPKARLIVLMENVIKNKGVFVVPGMEA